MYKIAIENYEEQIFIMDDNFELETEAIKSLTNLMDAKIDKIFAAFLGRRQISIAVEGQRLVSNNIYSVNLHDIKHFVVYKVII